MHMIYAMCNILLYYSLFKWLPSGLGHYCRSFTKNILHESDQQINLYHIFLGNL